MKRFVGLLAVVFSVGLVAADADAQVTVNSEIPGSVLIAQKFLAGTVHVGTTSTAQAIIAPRTEIEVGAVCPGGVVPGTTFPCPSTITVQGEWVCPGTKASLGSNFLNCREVDFSFTLTPNGKVFFSPEGSTFTGENPVNTFFSRGPGDAASASGNFIPPAPCDQGFLLMWVVNNRNARVPINLNVLVGEAILREGDDSAGAYNLIPVQAVPGPGGAGVGGPIIGAPNLAFTGLVGEYALLPNTVAGDIRFDRRNTTNTPNNLGAITSFLTLLTLDIVSNREVNLPVNVDFLFFNEQEQPFSVSTEFVCWQEIALSGARGCEALDVPTCLSSSLNEVTARSRKGLFWSAPAVSTTGAPRTLLGIVETKERRGGVNSAIEREYAYNMFHLGTYVPTAFVIDPSVQLDGGGVPAQ